MNDEEANNLIVSFTKNGVAHFDKYTVTDYVQTFNDMVKQLQKAQEMLRQLEVRANCIRNEIEHISPKAD